MEKLDIDGIKGYDDSIKISYLELDSIAKRIMALSVKDIDRLWKMSGWVDSEAEADKNEGLPKWRIEKIKNDRIFAIDSFIRLISDEPYNELRMSAFVLNNLSKIDNKEII